MSIRVWLNWSLGICYHHTCKRVLSRVSPSCGGCTVVPSTSQCCASLQQTRHQRLRSQSWLVSWKPSQSKPHYRRSRSQCESIWFVCLLHVHCRASCKRQGPRHVMWNKFCYIIVELSPVVLRKGIHVNGGVSQVEHKSGIMFLS